MFYNIRYKLGLVRYNKIKMRHMSYHYADLDYRMFHAIFQCLCDYIEIELAHMATICSDDYELTKIEKIKDLLGFTIRSERRGVLYLIDYGLHTPFHTNEFISQFDANQKRKLRQLNLNIYKSYIVLLNNYIWYKTVYLDHEHDFHELDPDVQDKEITNRLSQLVKLRGYMWT
jgi:hypothetical protein